MAARIAPAQFVAGGGHGEATGAHLPALIDDDTPTPEHALFAWSKLVKVALLGGLLWLLPIAQLACKGMYWPVGDSWRALGVFIFYLGSNLILAAVKENPWFIPQLEPPPALVITGVYAWFKHPGYIGLSLQALGQFLLFGQTWGTLPLVIYLVLLWRRARQEDLLLRGK